MSKGIRDRAHPMVVVRKAGGFKKEGEKEAVKSEWRNDFGDVR